MKKVCVLGCGMVGSAMVKDLSDTFEVLAADSNQSALNELSDLKNITVRKADLSQNEVLQKLIKDADFVVNALPGSMGFDTLRQIILAGKHAVDISFFPEDPFELDELAKKHKVSAVIDAGVAPGMGNIICGYHHAQSKLKSYVCYVGGLPVIRRWPHEYKAPFSPSDVIEEYLRPARYLQNGKLITRKALSEKEFLNFEQIGTLEAFNTDGLRTLLKTTDIPDMIEKTMRYPGTSQRMEMLREMGFFGEEALEINGTKIRPIDFTSKLLFPQWKLEKTEEEFTIMRIILSDENEEITYDLFDFYDKESKISSMARTTGYTCTAVVNLMAEGIFNEHGIIAPEIIGRNPEAFDYITEYLKKRDVIYTVSRRGI
jgi:saccharopine dehydrogenase-like NADP-dependent oxidoreductase